MRVVLLYAELADYTLACLQELKRRNIELLVIHQRVNPEAPFTFEFGTIGSFICIDEFNSYDELRSRVQQFGARVLVCSGWNNRWYLKIAKELAKQCLNILALDNHWTGTLRQHVLSLVARRMRNKYFHTVWVPGLPQVEYARRLGFTEDRIMTGFYSCDVPLYDGLRQDCREPKLVNFPRRFLCVARYIPEKNLAFLWKAFIKWKAESGSEWELWCAGTGAGFPDRIMHPSIKHLGFIQKGQWPEIVSGTGVFVLPSSFEPWGVAVHEFAAAGYPLLISKNVGAATRFVSSSNGILFDPRDEEELVAAFQKISSLSPASLIAMGDQSNTLAKQLTPATWAETFLRASRMN